MSGDGMCVDLMISTQWHARQGPYFEIKRVLLVVIGLKSRGIGATEINPSA